MPESEAKTQPASVLDVLGPYRGPCLMGCGGNDARHRLADSIVERFSVGGETMADLAADYQITREVIYAVLCGWSRGNA
jgi:hypothetical protein